METITATERIKQNKLRKIQILAEQKKNWRKKKIENTKPTGKNQIVPYSFLFFFIFWGDNEYTLMQFKYLIEVPKQNSYFISP
jgi:hypothetical protein